MSVPPPKRRTKNVPSPQSLIRSQMAYSLSKLNDKDTLKQGVTEIMNTINETDINNLNFIIVCIMFLSVSFYSVSIQYCI